MDNKLLMDLLKTRSLVAAVKEVKPPTTFIQDRYFSTTPADIFKTQEVLVQYKRAGQPVSPYIFRRSKGITLKRDGWELRKFEPPMIGLKRELTIDQLEQMQFGEGLYAQLLPEQRVAKMLMDDIQDLTDANTRKREVMCAEVIFNNSLICNEYNDDMTEVLDTKEIFFYPGNVDPAQYTIADDWDTSVNGGKKIIDDLHNMIRKQNKRGIRVTEMLCGPEVADIILNNEYFWNTNDNRGLLTLYNIIPEELPGGVTKVGRLNVKGRFIDIYSYEEEYEDPKTHEVTPYVPYGMIALGSPSAYSLKYGAITQMEMDNAWHTYAGVDIPRSLADWKAEMRELGLRSRPLPMPIQESPFVIAKVLGN